MHPVKGPRQAVSVNPNGELDYNFNPMENLSVEEFAPWEYPIIDDSNITDYRTEPVFSSQTLYISAHENTPNS
ncbi:MAG TPA: hypothetical protein VMV58_02085 [Desulfosporosinus sp.]|nr:hypothetical protein [Desulfosporosinus sp.]